MDFQLPKILIVSRGVWDDDDGTSSTLSNVFENYDPDKLAHIYIETKRPSTKLCNLFFQISEFSLIHKLYKWNTRTGFKFENTKNIEIDETTARQEDYVMNFVCSHRSMLFTIAREFLWLFNGWKSKALKEFILDFKPDLIWMDGSPLILMNRLGYYVQQVAQKPMITYEVDDVYTYQSCPSGFLHYCYQYFLRKSVRRIMKYTEKLLVISPKMKREYDLVFGKDSVVVTKGIDFTKVKYKPSEIHTPIRLVYLGQVIYGRIYSLIALAKAVHAINKDGIKMTLNIYTNNTIPETLQKQLLFDREISLMPAVAYSQVPNIIEENDVLVFVESFEKKYKNIARLSFSTKITDYLASSKCILAIGPADIAPMEYLKEEDAALIVTDLLELPPLLKKLLDTRFILKYSTLSFNCGLRNHNQDSIEKQKLKIIKELYSNSKDYSSF